MSTSGPLKQPDDSKTKKEKKIIVTFFYYEAYNSNEKGKNLKEEPQPRPVAPVNPEAVKLRNINPRQAYLEKDAEYRLGNQRPESFLHWKR